MKDAERKRKARRAHDFDSDINQERLRKEAASKRRQRARRFAKDHQEITEGEKIKLSK